MSGTEQALKIEWNTVILSVSGTEYVYSGVSEWNGIRLNGTKSQLVSGTEQRCERMNQNTVV